MGVSSSAFVLAFLLRKLEMLGWFGSWGCEGRESEVRIVLRDRRRHNFRNVLYCRYEVRCRPAILGISKWKDK